MGEDFKRISVEETADGQFEVWRQSNHTSRWGLGKVSLEELRLLDEEVSRVLRPTAEQVYESTLDGLFDGESDGDAESPTGWFALVHWPNGHSYLVLHGSLGFSRIIASTAQSAPAPTRQQLQEQFDRLQGEFSEWFSENYDDDPAHCPE